MAGTLNDPQLPGGGPFKIEAITDGTSNTMIMSECGGKPVGYNRLRQIYKSEVDGLPVDGSIEPVSSAGGAWADMFIYSVLAGGKCDNSGQRLGPCMINCTSNNEIYSWHTGGANALFVDGSVHFLKETSPAALIVALVTRAGGEPLMERLLTDQVASGLTPCRWSGPLPKATRPSCNLPSRLGRERCASAGISISWSRSPAAPADRRPDADCNLHSRRKSPVVRRAVAPLLPGIASTATAATSPRRHHPGRRMPRPDLALWRKVAEASALRAHAAGRNAPAHGRRSWTTFDAWLDAAVPGRLQRAEPTPAASPSAGSTAPSTTTRSAT